MRCLTLTEPWATLVAIGAKTIETRSWATSYRGPIAIHAAKGLPIYAADLIREPGPIWDAITYYADELHAIPATDIDPDQPNGHLFASTRGKVIATARCINCLRTEVAMDAGRERNTYFSGMALVDDDELAFGDFGPNRYAWVLRNVQRLPEPIPARGALGLWELDDALLAGLAMSRGRGRVVHVRDNVPGAVYIGRAMPRFGLPASPWRNPYKIGTHGTRADCLFMYADDLAIHRRDLAHLPELRGKPLACWCRHDEEPKTDENACHGDILLDWLDRFTDDELREMSGVKSDE